MSNAIKVIAIKDLIELSDWLDIPNEIVTREGHPVNTSTDFWHLPYSLYHSATLDFTKIMASGIRWVTKRYVQEKLEYTSTHAGLINYKHVWWKVLRHQEKYEVIEGVDKSSL